MERIFLRDVAGIRAGEIREFEWKAFEASARFHHGVTDPVDSYTMGVEEAARRWVQHLSTQGGSKDASRGRARTSGNVSA